MGDGGGVKSLYGATVLVIGFGDIGNEFARRARQWVQESLESAAGLTETGLC